MKKILFAVASLAALFSCAKEEQAPVQNAEPFRIEANFNADTKTTFNPVDYSVEWEETDELSVLINDGTSTKLYKFTKVADAANAFECADFVPAAGVDYTYNVLYPYSSYAKDIDADGYCTGYIELPSKGNANLTQSALNDAAHVKGTLYAQASAAGTEAPVVNMVHLTHILKAKITNKTAADLKISGVSVTNDADVALAGDYFVNFTTGDFKLKSGSALKTTSVSVSGTLAAGETGFVYIVTPAFTIPATKSLTFTVTCEGGSAEIVKTMESELVCEAGTVSTANIEVTSIVPEEEPITIPDGDYWMIADGKVAVAFTGNYGEFSTEDAVNGVSYAVNAFTFKNAGEKKYTIRDSNGRYVYMNGIFNNFNASSTLDSEDEAYYWNIYESGSAHKIVNCGKSKYIQYITANNEYGSFVDEQGVVPALVLAENPIQPTVLATPASLVASDITSTSVTLTWDAVENAGKYEISYRKSADSEGQTALAASTASTTGTVYSLDPETEYTFYVVAKSASKEWADSEAASVSATTTASTGGETPKAWTLVTDATSLKAGDKVVIVASGFDFALSTTQNNNNRGQAAVTKSGNTVTFEDGVQELTLEAGTVDGTWALNTGAGYLYAAGGTGKNNYLKTQQILTAPGYWTIAINNDIATIKTNDSTVARHTMKYNSSNKLFSCYASGQQDISIYKWQ